MHFDTKFHIFGSTWESRHTVISSSNFQKLMRVRYTSGLRTFQVVKIFFPRSGGFIKLQKKKKKKHVERFFQFLMLYISSIKELLHKSSEIQRIITGTLPGKLKKQIYWT